MQKGIYATSHNLSAGDKAWWPIRRNIKWYADIEGNLEAPEQ